MFENIIVLTFTMMTGSVRRTYTCVVEWSVQTGGAICARVVRAVIFVLYPLVRHSQNLGSWTKPFHLKRDTAMQLLNIYLRDDTNFLTAKTD